MGDRSGKDQMISGLSLSATFLVGVGVIGMFCGGIIAVTHPERVRPESFLLRRLVAGTYSLNAGWIYLTVSTVILLLTMDRWVRVLPGLFAYSTLGGFIMLSGRYSGVAVPLREALFLTLFTISTAVVSWTFRRRKLLLIDRVALMAFLFCLAIGVTPDLITMFKALSLGFTFLLLAWAVNRFSNPDGRSPSKRLPNSSADNTSRD